MAISQRIGWRSSVSPLSSLLTSIYGVWNADVSNTVTTLNTNTFAAWNGENVITSTQLNTNLFGVWNADALGTSLDTSIYAAYNGDNVNDSSGNARNGTNVNNVTFTTGKVGNALTFNGGNYVALPNSSFDFTGDFSISTWVKIPSAPSASGFIFHNGNYDVATSYGYGLYINTNRTIGFYIGSLGGTSTVTSTTVLALNTWYHVTIKRDSVAKRSDLYINGVFEVQATNTNLTIGYGTRAIQPAIGAYRGNNQGVLSVENYFNGQADALTIWNKKLTDNEIISLYNEGAGAEFPFSSQLLPSLNDAVSTNHGTRPSSTLTGGVVGPSFTTGKIGKAFLFDGVNDMVALPNSSFDFTGDFSISTWVKIPANPSGYSAIFGNYNYDIIYNLGYNIGLGTDRKVYFSINGSAGSFFINSTTTLALNTWYHITVRRDSVAKTSYLYINGTLEAQATNTNITITYGTRAIQPTIGASRINNQGVLSSQNHFNGQIDTLTIWNKALTTSEVSALYNSGNAQQYPFSNVALSGVTSDALGNYDGTNNGVTFTTGKLGTNSFSFNGSSNFVALPQSALNFNKGNSGQSIGDFSVSFWLNLNTGSGDYQTVIGNWGDNGFGWQVVMFGGSFTFFGSDGSNGSTARIQHSLGLSKATATNQWVHVVVAYTNQSQVKSYVNGVLTNTTSTTYQVKTNSRNNGNLGCFPQSGDNSSTKYWFLNGKLDAVTLWTKALTDTEASALYNDGTGYQHPYPSSAIGYTSTLDDATSNANHGTRPSSTLTGGALGPSFTAGKIGQAFTFDGVNDYIALPNNTFNSLTGDFSFSLWFNASVLSGFKCLIGNYTWESSTFDRGFQLILIDTRMDFRLFGSSYITLSASGTFTTNTWNHIVVTRKASTGTKIYVNGSLNNSNTSTVNPIYAATNYSSIGASKYNSTNIEYYFNGKIDAVSTWSKELSATEVTDLYNTGNGKQYPNY